MSQSGLVDIEAATPTLPTSFTTDSGTAIPVVNNLEILGGTGLGTTGAGNVVTVNLDSPVLVSNGGTGATSYVDGQLLIGNSTGNTLDKATLTAGAGMTITNAGGSITLASSGVAALSFPTDSGTATPAANALTIAGGTGINTSGAGATATINLDSPVLVANGGTGVSTITGILTGNGTSEFVGRTITGTTGEITVANGTGVSGNPTVNLDVEAQVSLNTGLITGGILSIGTPPNKFSISDGNGVIVDCTTNPLVPTITPVSWTGKTDIVVTGIAAQLITFVLIDNSGSVIQQPTAPTQANRRTHIVIGVVVHVDLVNVDAVNNEQQTCINTGAQLYDLMDGLGFFNVNGNVFSPNAAANLTFDKSVGDIVKAGSNWNISPQNPHILTLASLAIASFQYRFQDGTNGVTGTVIDPNIYDVAGVSTPVPNNKYTIQRIYSFISNNVKIQPGQTIYSSLAEAKGSIQTESFVTEPSILANGLLRGFLCIKKGATDLTNTAQAFFISAGKFGGSSGVGGLSVSTMQNVYDNSVSPEIVVNSTNGALSIQDASSPLGANLLEVQVNGGGTDYFAVTANGVDIDGALTITTDLAVAHGGTGASTLTDGGVLLGSGTGAITALGQATNGQLVVGSSGVDPVLATLTAGTDISITNAAGSITINSTATGGGWVEETGTTRALVVNENVVGNNASLITMTLPDTAAFGSIIRLAGKGAGLIKVGQNASEIIHFGTSTTTTGVGGSITSTQVNDAVELLCIVADTEWQVLSSVGSWTVA